MTARALLPVQPPAPPTSVNGRYRGVSRGGGSEIDLRIDVDGPASSHRISADIFDIRPDPAIYRGSLTVVRPRRTDHEHGIMLAGKGSFTSSTATPWITVWIPHVGTDAKPRATLSRYDRDRQPGPVYDCTFESPHLRRIELIEDHEEGIDALQVYEPGAGCGLTIASVLAAAGIQLERTSRAVIKTSAAGPDAMWSDAELHAALVSRLGTSSMTAGWALWLLHAGMSERDRDSDGTRKIFGLTFDRRHRHGCAVFYRWLSGASAEQRRAQLYTSVHEIGHALNLGHCWRDSIVGPARPDALTWMNDPRGWRRGEPAFWQTFAFAFDAAELAHLRHGFLDDVIMGGSRHSKPAPEPDPWPRAVDDADAGLRLRIFAPRELQYGLPMTVGLELSATTMNPRPVPPVLGPRPSTVDIIVRPPGRPEFVFDPVLRHCREDAPVYLRAGDRPVRDYAFIHYGKHGFEFADPGRYVLRARFVAADGAVVLSEPTVTEVRPPLSQADNEARRWLYGHEQGMLMSLMGSTSTALSKGDDRLQEFIDRHPSHPAACVARLVRGTNAARAFKTIKPDGDMEVTERDASTARALLSPVLPVEALRRIASDAADERAAERAVDAALARMGGNQQVPAAVNAFIRSRRHEIGAPLVPILA